jgi:divalent metal cation (Fe/Co/Zn/Cd) transporter
MPVREAHDIGMKIEDVLRNAVPNLEVTIHFEPIEEGVSYEDNTLRGIEP